MRRHPGNKRLDDLFFGLVMSGFAICLTAVGAMHLRQSAETTVTRYESGMPTFPATHSLRDGRDRP